MATVPPSTDVERPSSIGPYVVTGVLGEGGMGVVYAAEQRSPIRRRVAVKVVRADRDRGEGARRFETERQALAMMEHPSIAQVLDAGSTASGRSYFVMEYVDGVPFTRYCDEHRLPVRRRLALFLDVCGAVAHAHQKGIIHRDLKPSNVLVSEQAGEALPKVIDFGIAKAIDRRPDEASFQTSLGDFIGTPAYMSPEQAEGMGADVDTRSDVYALGVLLYELLSGTLPADPARMGFLNFMLVLTSRLANTQPPSARVLAAPESAGAIAAARATDVGALARALRGDLDAIVLRAIAPERERRYQTVRELAQDVERHLRDEPIAARAPSLAYRASKFARRHTTLVAVALSAVIALAGIATVAAVQAARVARARDVAERRRAQAETLIDFMVGDLRDRLQGIGRLELLADVGERARRYFAAVPPSELSEAELARRSQSLIQLGEVRIAQGDLPGAMQAFRESLDQARALAVRAPTNAAWQAGLGASHFYVGEVHYLHGDLDSALAHFVPYLDVARRLVAHEPAKPEWQLELAYAHASIGSVREARGDLAGALAEYRFNLEVKERLVAHDPTDATRQADVGDTHNLIGRALERMGQLDSARAHYLADLTIKRDVAQRDTGNAVRQQALAAALSFAGAAAELRGEYATARARYDSAHRVAAQLMARDSTNSVWLRDHAVTGYQLGRVETALGARAAGREHLQAARRVLQAQVARDTTNGDYRVQLAYAESELARALADADRAAARRAIRDAESRVAALARRPGAGRQPSVALATVRRIAADLAERSGAHADARRLRLDALAALGPAVASDELRAVEERARLLAGLGRTDEAAPLVARLRRAAYHPPDFDAFASAVLDPRR